MSPDDSAVDLVIVGFSGHGRETACWIQDVADQNPKVKLVGFVDDDETKKKTSFHGVPMIGNFQDLERFLAGKKGSLHYLTAAGDNQIRANLVQKIRKIFPNPPQPWTLIHPSVIQGKNVRIDAGAAVFPGSILTSDIQIGAHCILNVHVSVSHDTSIGDFTNLNPGVTICGNVTIGSSCYIGAGATVINKVSIGAGTIVGAGATVVKDLPERVLAVGTPAKAIKHL